MIKKSFLLILFLFLASCGSHPAPLWQQNAYANASNFISNQLSGQSDYASTYFERMVNDFKMTVDPDEIVKAYLIRCAADYAMLEYSECKDAEELLPMLKNKENLVYYNFVSGKVRSDEDVPEKYKDVFEAAKSCDIKKANAAVSSGKSPLNKLIKASFLIKSRCYDVETVEYAAGVASREGWKKAALKYLALEEAYYEKQGDAEKSGYARKRMELVVTE